MNYVILQGCLINLDSMCSFEKEDYHGKIFIIIARANDDQLYTLIYEDERERDEEFERVKLRALCRESCGICP